MTIRLLLRVASLQLSNEPKADDLKLRTLNPKALDLELSVHMVMTLPTTYQKNLNKLSVPTSAHVVRVQVFNDQDTEPKTQTSKLCGP